MPLNTKEATIKEERIVSERKKEKYYSNQDIENAVLIEKLLPINHSKTGNIDYTSEIQVILKNHRNVIFPNYPLLINDNGLKVESNSNLFFQEKSLLKFISSSIKLYSVLDINGVENINIYAPNINGDRNRRRDPTNFDGEWGMGIRILSSHNVKVYNAHITDCWGDGIYLGTGDISRPNTDITIQDPTIINNRRNGISIVSAASVIVNNAYISNTNGTRPGAGIDIEPNNNNDVIGEITLNNIHTVNNENYGILLVLKHLVGVKQKNTLITITNHVDENSETGFRVAGFLENNLKENKAITGLIRVVNPIWKNNKVPLLFQDTHNMFPLITFKNAKVHQENKTKDFSADYFKNLNKNLFKNQAVFN